MSRIARFLPVLVLFSQALPATAQIRVDLSPRLGMIARTAAIGPVAPAGGAWFLRLERIDPSAAFELEARITRPGSPVSARIVGLAVPPAGADGVFECAPGFACPAVLLESASRVSVLAAVADLTYSPVRTGNARPFAALGVGVKRWAFSWPAPAVLVEGGNRSAAALAVHLAAGMDLDLGGHALRLELADWWSGEGDVPVADGATAAPRRAAQHDVGITIGWRLLRF